MPLPTPRLCVALAAAGLLLAHALPAGSAARQRLAAPSSSVDSGPGRVIVTYRTTRASALSAHVQAQGDGPLREAQTLSQRHALDLRDGRTVAPHTQVLFSDTLSSEQLRQKLAADPDIASVTVDHRRFAHAVPNDPIYPDGIGFPYAASGQWYVRPATGLFVAAINAEQAWDKTAGSSSIVVAVLDTGVRPTHPDLAGKLLPGIDLLPNAISGNDGNGWDGDPSDPGDWVTSAESQQTLTQLSGCDVQNSSWHGTASAALIGAATNNGIGTAGIGGHTQLLPVRVLGKCGGFDSDIAAGMRWAAGLAVPGLPLNPHPAKVVNLSLGGPGSCPANSVYPSVISELTAHGVTIVASAGNDHASIGTPANCSGVVAVVGLAHNGQKVDFSDFGSNAALGAPAGSCSNNRIDSCASPTYPIISATNTGTQAPALDTYFTEASGEGFGTSYSAPMVSATVALMLAANPRLSPNDIRNLLLASTRSFPNATGQSCDQIAAGAQTGCDCTTSTCGSGMLDTAAAVQSAATGLAVAHIGNASEQLTPGAAVTLDASRSSPSTGGSIQTWQWSIIDGSGNATLSADTGPVTVLLPSSAANGEVTVMLVVTDSNQRTASATQRFVWGAAPSIVTAGVGTVVDTPTSNSGSNSSGGGGGTLDGVWIFVILAVACAAAKPRSRKLE